MRHLSCLLATALALNAPSAVSAPLKRTPPTKRELTPADAIVTTRVMQAQAVPGHPIDASFASPDGQRYLVRTAHGDLKRNGVWVDLWTGSLSSLAATTPWRCAHLFTTGLGPQYDDAGA